MVGMVDLEPGETGFRHGDNDVVGHDRPAFRSPRMRENRYAAGISYESDGLDRVEGMLGDPRPTPVPYPLKGERLRGLWHDAGLHHRAGDVWPADGSVGGEAQNRVMVDRRTEFPQPVHHRRCPPLPVIAQGQQLASQHRLGGVEQVGQQVQPDHASGRWIPDSAGDLGSADKGEAAGQSRGRRCPPPGGVVVGQGHDVETGSGGPGHHLGRRPGPVGRAGVDVQVDARASLHGVAHVNRPPTRPRLRG